MEYRFDAAARYSKTHEWVRVAQSSSLATGGGEALVGVSDYAQDKLSDVVYVEPPGVGKQIVRDRPFAVIESVKAAEDVLAPVSGIVLAANPKLEKAPELVNKDPYGEGWIARVKIEDGRELDSLMDADAYRAYLETL